MAVDSNAEPGWGGRAAPPPVRSPAPWELLLIGVLYAATGVLGHWLAVHPADAPMIWPPSGLALAALLLFGVRAWPGLVLGAVALEFCLDLHLPPSGLPVDALAAAAANTGGTFLLAGVGSVLVRRFGRFPNALDDNRSVLSFFGLGGVVAGIFGATFSSLVLLLFGHLTGDGLLFHWMSGWVGGTLGVVLFTPLILAWWSADRQHWAGRRRTISLSLGFTFAATLLLVGYTALRERETYRQELDLLATTLVANLEKTVTLYTDAVASVQSFSGTAVKVDGEAFADFASPIRQRVPGIRSLNWISRVSAEERQRFEAPGAIGGRSGIRIKQLQDGQWVPAGSRDEYFPVTFTDSALHDGVGIGFDLASNPSRRACLDQARDSGRLVVSERLALVTGGDGILAILPVYDRGQPTDTVENRRKALRGMAVGVFAAADLVAGAFDKSETSLVRFWLLDETAPAARQLLGSNAGDAPSPLRLDAAGLFEGGAAFLAKRSLHVGGRHWTLAVAPTEAFLRQFREDMAWYVMLAGLLFTGLVGTSVLIVTGRELALRRTAEERAAALTEVENLNERIRQEADSRFDIVVGNVGEAIIIIDGQGRIETFNKAAEQTFGYEAGEVLGKTVCLLMTESDSPRAAARLDRLLRKGASRLARHSREISAKRKNGEVFSAELTVGQAPEDHRHRYIAFIRDITDRKKIERDLRESERRFRDLAGSASDWFWETDPQYRLTFVSERIGAILGVKSAEVLGLSYFDLGLDEHDATAQAHRDDIALRKPFRDLVFHVGPQGDAKDSKFIRLSGIPVFDEAGEFQGYRGIGADITREVLAERRANRAYQQMADAIENIVDAIAVFDPDDQLVICNREYRRVFGTLGVPLAPGLPFETIIDVGGRHRMFDTGDLSFTDWKEKRLLQHRQATGTPFIVRLGNGRWIQNREFRTSDGGIVGVRTDISDSKRREEELEDLRRRYALILDSAGEGIVGLDRQGQVTFANRTAGHLLGFEPHEMIGRSFDRLVSPRPADQDIGRRDDTPLTIACREGTTRQVGADTFHRRDGNTLPVDYLVAPIVEAEQHVGAVMLFRDATLRIQYERSLADHQHELERQVAERTAELTREMDVRIRVEEALRASRERHKRVTDSLFEGVIVVDRNGHVIFANPSALRLLRWETLEGDIEGHPLDAIFHLNDKGVEIFFDGSPWQRVIAENVMLRDDDATFVTASGQALSVAYACSLLPYAEGRHAAIISFRDIEMLKQAQRDAIQASRLASVGQLAAGIAHEINTPAQYVGDNLRYIGKSFSKFADVVAAGRMLASQTGDLAAIEEAGSRFEKALAAAKIPALASETEAAIRESLDGVAQIARIVLSMKEFSHPGTSTKTTTDINKALESTLTVSRNEWKHAADIEKNLDPELPKVVCLAGEMNQVFLNLIVNAAHAIEASGKSVPGRITISTSHADGQIEIRVADNGTGIPENIREKIFDPFFTTKEVGKGTGQGLAICRDVVVTKHGGAIDVTSREGEGTEFVIFLPVGGEDAPAGDFEA